MLYFINYDKKIELLSLIKKIGLNIEYFIKN
ncbi:hypothetical protein c7_L9 [Megavirus courdo7]|uniref:Uncharacterized protein n=1 Tax=Megavirus courdo7 TaxID=1128135 RepID=H2E9K2_9VIRU|nr:hypothetical protein c7_L9 [Megavirus courdo7]